MNTTRYFTVLTSLLSGLLLSPLCLHAQNWQWVSTQAAGTAGISQVTAMAIDAAGNAVVAGTITGTVTLGSTTLTSVGGSDVFVGRLNAAGVWTQAVRAGGPGSEQPSAVKVDAQGNVVVAGRFVGATIGFGATTLMNTASGTSDIFVARLDAAGAWTQAVGVGGVGDDYVEALTLDAAGNATVAGNITSPTVAFGSFTLINADNTGGTSDIFVARLSAAGIWTQALRAGSSSYEFIQAITQDAAGTVYIAGGFGGPSLTLGTTTLLNAALPNNPQADVFVAQLSPAGIWGLAVRGGGTGFEQPNAIALDGNGNVIITGLFTGGTTAFGSFPLTAPPLSNTYGYLARLSPAGIWTQASSYGGTDTFPNGLAADASGNAIVVGQFSGTGQFGSITLSPPATVTGLDIFVARLSLAGTWTNALRAGTNNLDSGIGVFFSGSTVLISGNLQTPASAFNLGSAPLTATNSTAFVGRLTGLPTATRGAVASSTLALLPNPAHVQTTLLLPIPLAAEATAATLLDALGRPVRTYALLAHATTVTLDLTGLAPGLYIVRCGAASGKLVVE